jgi:galactokinase
MPTLLDKLVAKTCRGFEDRHGVPPRWVVAAPGRVNLIGEHIDYSDGFVLPMAIDRYTVIAAGEGENDEARMMNEGTKGNSSFVIRNSSLVAVISSEATNEEVAISLDSPQRHPTRGHWSNYVAGVIDGCLARGMRPGGFRAVIGSDVPLGGGLSSSAALEVATATLMETMSGVTLDPVAKALLCQKAEHEYAGVPCGIMDQFASTLSTADHLMLLDCRSRQVELIPFTDPTLTVLIINSNVKHELSGGEYAERRGQCETAAQRLGVSSLRDATLEELAAARDKLAPVEYRRARHAISEIARTVNAAKALKAGDWPAVGKHMAASHASLRDDYEVSCRELDLLVDLADGIGRAGGVYGSRMTGGGFGGCTVNLVDTERVDEIAARISTPYEREIGVRPTVLTSRPAQGAHVVQAPA